MAGCSADRARDLQHGRRIGIAAVEGARARLVGEQPHKLADVLAPRWCGTGRRRGSSGRRAAGDRVRASRRTTPAPSGRPARRSHTGARSPPGCGRSRAGCVRSWPSSSNRSRLRAQRSAASPGSGPGSRGSRPLPAPRRACVPARRRRPRRRRLRRARPYRASSSCLACAASNGMTSTTRSKPLATEGSPSRS